MSWDAEIIMPPCQTCRRSIDVIDLGNYTHNTNGMVRRAIVESGNGVALEALGERHLYALSRMSCDAVAEILAPAMEWWGANHEAMQDLEPSNGWGSSEGAHEWWSQLTEACRANPTGTLYLCG